MVRASNTSLRCSERAHPARLLFAEAQAELGGGDEGVRARISLHAADIMDEEAVKAAVEGAADAHGRLDGVVSSAGTSLPRLFEAISAEQWEWMLRLNVVGTRNVIAASLPHLKASDAGRIVMVSSSAGQVGVFGFTLYSVSGPAPHDARRTPR